MRIAHISLDEKFIDCAINQFSLLKGVDSVFCVKTENSTLKYIKSPDVKLFQTFDEIVEFINNDHFDYVVFHSFCIPQNKVESLNVPILWNSWGYDIYSDESNVLAKPITLSLYKPKTRAAANIKPKTLHDRILILARKFGIVSKRQKKYDALISKIPYLSVVLPIEFDYIHKKYPHFKFFPFRYIDPSESIAFTPYTKATTSILLGNSVDPTNNHIDILSILEKRNIQCTVYIPISYPSNQETYKKALKSFAATLKTVKVRFLEDFIPKEEYFKIIDECSVAIFGHIRQQAVGNIFRMLYTGKKILMYKDSVGYNYFKQHNVKIFNIEDDLHQDFFEKPLDIESQKANYTFVLNDENFEAYIKSLQGFFDNITKV